MSDPSEPAAPDRTGWLPWREYLTAIENDGNRLVDVAGPRLEASVPSCPGWTAGDLLEHTADVYLHKIECMRNAAPPDPWPPPRPADRDLVQEFRAAHAALLAELIRRDPDERRFTWWPADRTNGFWYRRMALESAIHRVDAELAGDAVTPVPEPLALDGIDEVLCIMLAGEDWTAVRTEHPVEARVRIVSGERSWCADVRADAVEVTRDAADADTEISGAPHDMYLWLWGRGPAEVLSVSGDPTPARGLRARLAEAG